MPGYKPTFQINNNNKNRMFITKKRQSVRPTALLMLAMSLIFETG